MSYDAEYAARLEGYIESERFTHALYRRLAAMCRGEASQTLRRMSEDEARHLRAMQMEYYLLTGDTLPEGKPPEISGSLQDNLRMAYSGEWEAACGYAREAERSSDAALKKLYLAQSEDEMRHRAQARELVGRMTGMSGG